MSKFLLTAPLCLMLLSCSTVRVKPPTVRLPANLAAPCKAIEPLPVPFVDPLRSEWEAGVLYAYADCAARHAATVKALDVGK